MKDAALPPDPPVLARLKDRLASLALPPPEARASSPAATAVSGRAFNLQSNSMGLQTATFLFQKETCLFTLNDKKGEHSVQCGLGKWIEGETTMPGTPPKLTSGDLGPKSRVAAGAAWKDDSTFEMTWRFPETPHHDTVTCHFDGAKLTIQFMNSVTRLAPSHKETRPQLKGACG